MSKLELKLNRAAYMILTADLLFLVYQYGSGQLALSTPAGAAIFIVMVVVAFILIQRAESLHGNEGDDNDM